MQLKTLFLSLSCLLLSTLTANSAENTHILHCETSDKLYSATDCYSIIEELGEGGFGIVYAATNSKGEKVAIKRLKNLNKPGFTQIQHFGCGEREFKIGQLLDHPHILKTFELFTTTDDDGVENKNIAFEYVDGIDLEDLKKGTLTYDESVTAAVNLCQALRYAYTYGLIHMDLSGNNVMLSKDQGVKIIDVGSFFSIDDFIKNFILYQNSKTSGQKRNLLEPQAGLKLKADKIDPKFLEFAEKNPELIERLAKKVLPKVRRGLQAATATFDEEEMEIFRHNYHYMYLERISECCIQILGKSGISRTEKNNLRIQLKQIVWSYADDVEEEITQPFEHYLDKFIDLTY